MRHRTYAVRTRTSIGRAVRTAYRRCGAPQERREQGPSDRGGACAGGGRADVRDPYATRGDPTPQTRRHTPAAQRLEDTPAATLMLLSCYTHAPRCMSLALALDRQLHGPPGGRRMLLEQRPRYAPEEAGPRRMHTQTH